MKTLTVVQHTSAEYLGLMEDHFEGRRIRFIYNRPFTEGVSPPHPDSIADGLVLLGGGPWGSAGARNVPTLDQEIAAARTCLMLEKPIIGIGLGAQILALAAGGGVVDEFLRFVVGTAHRTTDDALNGYLPEQYPIAIYGRDRAVPPDHAKVLSLDEEERPVAWQIGRNAFGFEAHPGYKGAMIEDLIMEFDELPPNTGPTLSKLRAIQPEIADSLVPIMTGIIQLTELMKE